MYGGGSQKAKGKNGGVGKDGNKANISSIQQIDNTILFLEKTLVETEMNVGQSKAGELPTEVILEENLGEASPKHQNLQHPNHPSHQSPQQPKTSFDPDEFLKGIAQLELLSGTKQGSSNIQGS